MKIEIDLVNEHGSDHKFKTHNSLYQFIWDIFLTSYHQDEQWSDEDTCMLITKILKGEKEIISPQYENLSIREIIERNYAATVKRGLIKPETTAAQFGIKIAEEFEEFADSFTSDNDFDTKELADIVLVCFALAKHKNIDLIKAMEEKTIFNEQRKD